MKAQVLIDWLTFSVKNEKNPDYVIMEYLGMDPIMFSDSGSVLPGYANGKSFQNIVVCYDARENSSFHNMGVCVSMSGKGCRAFETMSAFNADSPVADISSPGWYKLLNRLHVDDCCNVSRVDLACDDRAGALDLDDIMQCVDDDAVNTRLQDRSRVVSKRGKVRTGLTQYLGSSKSDFFIRIYDKAAEQGQDGHWVRVEMCMRGDHANAFVELFNDYTDIGKLAAEILGDKVYFVELDNSNISRCTVCQWWLDFLQTLTAVRLVARGEVVRTLDATYDYLMHQVARNLAMIRTGKGWFAINELLKFGEANLSEKQRAIVRDYLNLSEAASSSGC